MINEIIFLIQTIFVSFILIFNSSKEKLSFLYQIFTISLILINILIQKEIILFGIHTTTVEPYSILIFWTSAKIYYIEGEVGAKKIIHSMIFTNILLLMFFLFFSIYTPYKNDQYCNFLEHILNMSIYSIIISTITFIFSYFIERKIFNLLIKKIDNIYSQSISISISQFFDTFIFSYLYFQKPIKIVFQIAFFSYLIKLICIIISTIFQKIYKNNCI
jgi:uncharacterized integral membrane protein (TIGR00697 family)